jgi:NAD-dependent deacetylase
MEAVSKLGLIPDPKLRVAVLTGAGISAESGVPIFRGKGSMWEIEEARNLARKAGPPWNTKETWEYYEWRRGLVSRCKPNAAHLTLVDMENYFEDFCLITQNVDGLHTRAGSRRVYELHGNIWKGHCPKDGELVDLPHTPLKDLPPYHSCGTALRPHVVQFGEMIDPETLEEAMTASRLAELFLVIGTSGVVSPAAQMPLIALENGAKVVEINRESTVLTPHVTLSLRGKAVEILPQFWKELSPLTT